MKIPNVKNLGRGWLSQQATATKRLLSDREITDKKDDQFGFIDYARVIADQALSVDTPLTIGIFGRWGSGKSSLMRLIEAEVQQKRSGNKFTQWIQKVFGFRRTPETCRINVWQLSTQEELWNAFLQALLTQVHKELPSLRRLMFDLQLLRERIDLGELIHQLLANGYRILLVIAPLWATSVLRPLAEKNNLFAGIDPNLSEGVGGGVSLILGAWLLLKPIVEATKDKVSLDLRKVLKDAPYEARVSALQNLEGQFRGMVEAWVGDKGRLVVFIDDLDRCTPNKIADVLEALKLFTATDGCVYVLGVDDTAVRQGIVTKYGFEPNEAAEYLEKIFQIPFELPRLEPAKIAEFIEKCYPDLVKQCKAAPEVFSKGLEPNPRKVKRVLNIYQTLLELAKVRYNAWEMDRIDPELLAKMVVIQSCFRKLHEDLFLEPEFLAKLDGPDENGKDGALSAEVRARLSGQNGTSPLVDNNALPILSSMLFAGTARFAKSPPPTMADRPTYIYLTNTAKSSAEHIRPHREDQFVLLSDDWATIQSKTEAILGQLKEIEKKPIADVYVERLKLVMDSAERTAKEKRSANLAIAQFEVLSSVDKIIAYTRAVERDPKDAAPHALLGEAYLNRGQGDDNNTGTDEWNRAKKLGPKDPLVRAILGATDVAHAVQPVAPSVGRTRPLRPDELATARLIFADGLNYNYVLISEGSRIPILVGQMGSIWSRHPAPQANAITLGNTSYFSRELTSDIADMAWLMHELTHQWQYQRAGWQYLIQSLTAPTYVYTDSAETPAAALERQMREGKRLRDFNPEQQGNIVRDYYFALKQVGDPNSAQSLYAWEPYLKEIRES